MKGSLGKVNLISSVLTGRGQAGGRGGGVGQGTREAGVWGRAGQRKGYEEEGEDEKEAGRRR